MNEVQNNILQWATEKSILDYATINSQIDKLKEEVSELEDELNNFPANCIASNEILLEFGDVLVVLTILAKQLDSDFETCLTMAYDKIKDRTGTMQNGTFVKD